MKAGKGLRALLLIGGGGSRAAPAGSCKAWHSAGQRGTLRQANACATSTALHTCILPLASFAAVQCPRPPLPAALTPQCRLLAHHIQPQEARVVVVVVLVGLAAAAACSPHAGRGAGRLAPMHRGRGQARPASPLLLA